MIDLGMELSDSTLITSKTDLQGNIVYCNKDFIRYSGFSESEIFLKPHNIVRHKDMPKAVFKLLWSYIRNGQEVFVFVKNQSKSGAHYWVLANVTPSFDVNNKVVGYYSVRRKPNTKAIEQIAQIYTLMLEAEKQSINDGQKVLENLLLDKAMDYNHFILALQEGKL